MNKVAREVAEQEINSWLDYKKIPNSAREDKEEEINKMIDMVESGVFLYDSENHKITFNLLFPNDELGLTSLVFAPRKSASAFTSYLKKVKSGDARGFITAHIACLTGQNTSLLSKLDTEDYKIAGTIASFFF